MKTLMIAAASLMVVATAQANDVTMAEVEMTPLVAEKQIVAKTDSRFDNYALENSAAGGQ